MTTISKNLKKITILTITLFVFGVLFSNSQIIQAATAGKYMTKVSETYISSLTMLKLEIEAVDSVGSVKVSINSKAEEDVQYKGSNKYEAAITGVETNDNVTLTAYDLDNKKVETLVYQLDSSGNLKEPSSTKVPVEKVKLNRKSLSMKVGDSDKLDSTIYPSNATNKNVTWKTSDSKIATVDSNGLVTALAAGTAEITVTTEDGNKTATCKVTVKQNMDVTDISLTLTMKRKSTIDLGVLITPDDATDKSVTWSSSKSSVASVSSSGKVKAVKSGTTVITARTKDGKKSTSITIIVKR